MLDALLAALPDSAYFKHMVVSENYGQQLRESEIPFAGYLRGAALWDLSRESSYPLYSIVKTNSQDNSEPQVGYGTLVLSSAETGELLTYPMKEESGKMPLANRRKPVRLPSNIPMAKTYTVNDLWRTLTIDDLHGGYGSYQAFLHMGSYQSIPYCFKTINSPEKLKDRPYESVLNGKEFFANVGDGIKGVKFLNASEIDSIASIGLTLIRGDARHENGLYRIPVSGSFKFSGVWLEKYERFPIHFLVSVSDNKEVVSHTLWLPKSKCGFKDGLYFVHFQFDLAQLFVTPWDSKPKMPKKAWISAVHRDWQGQIVKYEFENSP
jgi:hypothetical protein